MGSRLVARNFTFTSPSGDKVGSRFQLELYPMPTIVTHAAVPLCLGLGFGSRIIPPRLLLAGLPSPCCPMPTCSPLNWGRLRPCLWPPRLYPLPVVCLCPAHVGHAVSSPVKGQRRYRLVILLISLLSHSLLDSLTTGGKGLAGSGRGVTSASSPLAGDPGRPFKLEAYLTARGEAVILSELYWVWLPGAVLMLVLMGWRVWRRTPRGC